MINVSDITKAVKKMLEQAPSLNDIKSVERGEYVNMDPSRTPWVGVFRTQIDYSPKALGMHARSWKANIIIKLVVQASEGTGEATEDSLEDLVQRIMSVILTDLTLRDYVEMLNSLKIEYSYDETDSKTMDYQWAFVTLNYEARTGV